MEHHFLWIKSGMQNALRHTWTQQGLFSLTGQATGKIQRRRGCECGGTIMQILHARVMADMSRRQFLGGAVAMAAAFSGMTQSAGAASVAPQTPPRPVVIHNCRLFDGSGKKPQTGLKLVLRGGLITDILPESEPVNDAVLIDAGGKLLMPGLIDVHGHSMLAGVSQMTAMTSDVGYLYLVAAREAQKTLLRGFTTVRDPGGPSFALKRAIDEGIIDGPRIYPSGAMISQTSGHGDFRMRSDLPRAGEADLALVERTGVAMIADGANEVLRRVREQLMLGASQIKVLAGGGVASMYDPLDSTQFTEAELKAAVDAATDWNTYVMAHVYTPKGIQRCIRAGVKSIEHGQLADEETVKMMHDTDTWWSLQPFLQDEDANVYPDAARREAQHVVAQGTVHAYEMAQKYNIHTGWGTDVLFSADHTHTQGKQLAKLTRFYDPLTVLKQGTGMNGDYVALAGARNPYPHALGKLEKGAYADLIIADGDPEQNLDFIADPDQNFHFIMKNGVVYKNTL